MARFKKSNKINFLHYYFKTDDDFDNWSDSIWDILNSVSMLFCLNAITVKGVQIKSVVVQFPISTKNAECRYTEWRYAKCRSNECRCTERRYAKCRSTICHFASAKWQSRCIRLSFARRMRCLAISLPMANGECKVSLYRVSYYRISLYQVASC